MAPSPNNKRKVVVVFKTAVALVVLVTTGVMWAYARDLDKGTATDDGSGEPLFDAGLFTPNDTEVYFKLTNDTGVTVTIDHLRVRLMEPGDAAQRLTGGILENCGGGVQYVADSPLRTVVVENAFDPTTAPLDLNLQLAPCEAVLIQASNAVPGVDHIIFFRKGNPGPVGFLEIWDGECND